MTPLPSGPADEVPRTEYEAALAELRYETVLAELRRTRSLLVSTNRTLANAAEFVARETRPLRGVDMKPWPESQCQRCLGPNPVWHAPNELWNDVMGSEAGIVCPTCFAVLTTDRGHGEIFRLEVVK
jgi:hypothetical protein